LSPDTPRHQEDVEQAVLKGILQRHPAGAMFWVHDNYCDVESGGEPKVTVEPLNGYFNSVHAQRSNATEERARLKEETTKLRAQLEAERNKNDAARQALDHKEAKLKVAVDAVNKSEATIQELSAAVKSGKDVIQTQKYGLETLKLQRESCFKQIQEKMLENTRLRDELRDKLAKAQDAERKAYMLGLKRGQVMQIQHIRNRLDRMLKQPEVARMAKECGDALTNSR